MGFKKDLRLALVAIANADSNGSTGLVDLSGDENPLWLWGNHKDKDLPITTYIFLAGDEGNQANKNDVRVRFVTWTDPSNGATYVEQGEDIRDRIVTVMTFTNLLAEGVNVSPLRPSTRDLSADDDGTVGFVLELDFFNGE